jgi:hypothetical protein
LTRRIILSEENARQIYECKQALAGSNARGVSSQVALFYNVSPKTVRDIWNRITWKFATCHLWSDKDFSVTEHSIVSDVIKVIT